MNRSTQPHTVGLIGTGMVGSAFAYALMQRGIVGELVMVDKNHDRAVGEAMDLRHGIPFAGAMNIRAGDYADLRNASVIVVTAGTNQQPDETRLDLLHRNIAIMRQVMGAALAVNREAIYVIASNPVDIMTQVAVEIGHDIAHGRIFGSGTILDTARFRYLLGQHYQVSSRSVHAYIIGEHGDSELAVWSLANIAGVRLHEFTGTRGQGYDPAALQAIFDQTRMAAYEIIRRKGATYYAIGLGLLQIVESIVREQDTVMTVTAPLNGHYGIHDMCVSVPMVVGIDGVEHILDIPLAPNELHDLQESAAILRAALTEAEAAPQAGA